MEHAPTTRLKACLVDGVVPVALVVCLPLLGLLAFAARPVLLVAVVVALVVGSILWVVSTRCREGIDAQAGSEIGYRGVRLAPKLAFDPSHSWALMNDVIVVGADDLVQATLGPVDTVELPPNGSRVHRGDRLFRLRHGDRSIEIRAPISGTVIGRNEALRRHPELVNEKPFGGGWAVRLHGDRLQEESPLLLRGRRARAWFHDDVDRVIEAIPPAEVEAPVGSGQLYRHIDAAAWSRLTETVFAPPQRVEQVRGACGR
jgi:glycine cleavage system H protein